MAKNCALYVAKNCAVLLAEKCVLYLTIYTLATVLFPLQMVVFLGVFAVSVFKKIFRLNVIWKGRAVSVEGETCE